MRQNQKDSTNIDQQGWRLPKVGIDTIFLLFFLLPLVACTGRPDFQAPHPCGQIWHASTYSNHGPDPDSIDLVERDADLVIIGEDQPVVASAPGRVVFDKTWPDGPKEDERWVLIDHQDGWRTHYFHLAEEEGSPRLTPGRPVAMGEVIGRASNSGATAVHLHYSQVRERTLDFTDLASAPWQTVMGDGEAVRIQFDGHDIDTHEGNPEAHWGEPEAEKIRSHNCIGGRFLHWSSDGENYILRYNPGSWKMRLNRIHPTDDDNPLMFEQDWEPNWNELVSFYIDDRPYLLLYNFASGETRLHRVHPGNDGLTLLQTGNIYAGWTHMASTEIDGQAHLVSYDSRYGWFNVDGVLPTNVVFDGALKTRLAYGFTQMVPYEEGPLSYVVLYRGSTGEAFIRQLTRDALGKVTDESVWFSTLGEGWTHLVALPHLGKKYVLGYNSQSGDARLWEIKPNGTGLELSKKFHWRSGWSALTPYTHNGRGHLLLYRLSDGLARKIRLKDSLLGIHLFPTKNWLKGYR